MRLTKNEARLQLEDAVSDARDAGLTRVEIEEEVDNASDLWEEDNE